MKIDDTRFHVNNWEDFVHKRVLHDLLRFIPEMHISDIDATSIDRVDYQKDANGEYRLLVTYTDVNGQSHDTVLDPAITQRVIQLANQEIVKHFLFHRNGEDININTMKFINDKLQLTLVDGDMIELDLKPLVPRINVIGPDGEVLQKNLNYHINDDKIVFVDLEGHETELDFKLLVHVSDFEAFEQKLEERLKLIEDTKLDQTEFDEFQVENNRQLDTKENKTDHQADIDNLQRDIDTRATKDELEAGLNRKVNQVDYDKFVDDTRAELDTKADKVKMADALNKKEDKTLHKADIDKLQAQINDRSTHAETDQAITETVKQVKDWANPIHEDLQTALADKVSKTLFETLQNQVADLDTVKLSKSDYEADKENFVAKSDLTNYATKVFLTQTLANYYDKSEIDSLLSVKADASALDSKVNASDLVADYYKKSDIDALIANFAKYGSLTSSVFDSCPLDASIKPGLYTVSDVENLFVLIFNANAYAVFNVTNDSADDRQLAISLNYAVDGAWKTVELGLNQLTQRLDGLQTQLNNKVDVNQLANYATQTYVNDKTDVKVITDQTDFNNLVTAGKYFIATPNYVNGPTPGAWWYLSVTGVDKWGDTQGDTTRILQIAVDDSTNANNHRMYYRVFNHDSEDLTWSAWEQIAKMSDIPNATDFVANYHKQDPNNPPQGFSFSVTSKSQIVPNLNLINDYYYLINFMEDAEKVQLAIPLGYNGSSKMGIYRRNKRINEHNSSNNRDWSDWTPVYEMPDLSTYATKAYVDEKALVKTIDVPDGLPAYFADDDGNLDMATSTNTQLYVLNNKIIGGHATWTTTKTYTTNPKIYLPGPFVSSNGQEYVFTAPGVIALRKDWDTWIGSFSSYADGEISGLVYNLDRQVSAGTFEVNF